MTVTRVSIGAVEILALVDVTPPPADPQQFFPEVPATAWNPYGGRYLAGGKFHHNFGFFVVRSPGSLTVVDTGLGPGPHERFGNLKGELKEQMAAAGVQLEDVNNVVITHLHLDHIGWNVTDQAGIPKATFPRARYFVPRQDWAYFSRPDVLVNNPAVKANILPLKDLGVMELVDDGYTVSEEISILGAPGHTPGHQTVVIASRGHKGIIVGDLFHSPVQVTEAEWCGAADMDKQQARDVRKGLLARLEQERFVVAAGHLLAGSNIGKVISQEGRRYWQPLSTGI